MKKLIIIISTLILTSCGSTYNLSTDYRIKSILTITEKGDTLAVPIRDFKFRVLDGRIRDTTTITQNLMYNQTLNRLIQGHQLL